MSKTKRLYAEEIKQALINGYPDIDWRLDERVIFRTMDAIVNDMAAKSMMNNWKAGAPGISEGFITTWDEVEVIDDIEEETNSYLTLPVSFVDLPMERGIDEIYPKDKSDAPSVVILKHREVRIYQNIMAGSMHRLAGYPEGNIFRFTDWGVKKDYGNMGVRLVVRDSSLISIDAEYPIPANAEAQMIKMCINWFREKREIPANKVRDKVDQA